MLPSVRRLAPRLVRFLVFSCLLTALGSAPGCDSADSATPTPSASKPSPPAPPDSAIQPVSTSVERPRRERPVPSFSGWTLDDEQIAVSDLLDKRLILFFFNPDIAASKVAARSIASLLDQRAEHNFDVLGISIGVSRAKARTFASEQGLDFRIVDDSSADIARRFGLRSPVMILGMDREGYMKFAHSQIPKESDILTGWLRESLRLPEPKADDGQVTE